MQTRFFTLPGRFSRRERGGALVRSFVVALVLMLTGAGLAIAQQAPIVLSPNGGEQYKMTDQVVVEFEAPGSRAVRIEYSPNGGRVWIVLDTAVDASRGTFSFFPGPPTPFGRVRITDVDDARLFDISNGNFTVLEAPSIAIYTPSEQDRLLRGSSHVITWLAGRIQRVNIEFSPNGGAPGSWVRLATGVDARRGYHAWTVPTQLTNQGKIRILDADGPTVGETGLFWIVDPPAAQPRILVLRPNGGEVYTVGDTVRVAWSSSNSTGTATISVSSDGGATWRQVGTAPTTGGVFSWLTSPTEVPQPGRNFRVRVQTSDGAVDLSDNDFEIRRLIQPRLTVVYPNGGEIFHPDSTITVTWTAADITGSVDIEYSVDSGRTWRPIGTASATAGSVLWTVPFELTSGGLVRVVGGPVADSSDRFFQIVEAESSQSIVVLSPNLATDEWSEATFARITWRAVGVARVDITLSTDGGASWGRVIAQNVEGASGQFDYRVPHLADTVLTSLLVRVAAVSGAPFDYSDATFRYRPTVAAIAGERIGATLNVAPNPATSTARVSWRNPATELRLYDPDGALVRSLTLDAAERSRALDVEGLPAGVYHLEVRGATGRESGRVVVR